MKVEVTTVEKVIFPHRFAWWSRWIDIAVIDYEYRPWLVQMRVSRTNAKQFTTRSMSGLLYRQFSASAIGDLVQMESKP